MRIQDEDNYPICLHIHKILMKIILSFQSWRILKTSRRMQGYLNQFKVLHNFFVLGKFLSAHFMHINLHALSHFAHFLQLFCAISFILHIYCLHNFSLHIYCMHNFFMCINYMCNFFLSARQYKF